MGVQEVALEFMRWIVLGTGTVLGIMVVIGLGMPRRKELSVRPYTPEKHS